MPHWGEMFDSNARARLSTCHPLLIDVADRAVRVVSFTIPALGGWRDRDTQEELYEKGVTKVHWPDSKHNYQAHEVDVTLGWAQAIGQPMSMAFDFAPWFREPPHIRWEETDQFIFVAGVILGVGNPFLKDYGYQLRLGLNWDMDDEILTDQGFDDYGHVELVTIPR